MDFILHTFAYFPLKLNQANMQMQRPRLWRRCLLSSLQAVPHCGASAEQGWQQHLDAGGLGGGERVEAEGVGVGKKVCDRLFFVFSVFNTRAHWFTTANTAASCAQKTEYLSLCHGALITNFIPLDVDALKCIVGQWRHKTQHCSFNCSLCMCFYQLFCCYCPHG